MCSISVGTFSLENPILHHVVHYLSNNKVHRMTKDTTYLRN